METTYEHFDPCDAQQVSERRKLQKFTECLSNYDHELRRLCEDLIAHADGDPLLHKLCDVRVAINQAIQILDLRVTGYAVEPGLFDKVIQPVYWWKENRDRIFYGDQRHDSRLAAYGRGMCHVGF